MVVYNVGTFCWQYGDTMAPQMPEDKKPDKKKPEHHLHDLEDLTTFDPVEQDVSDQELPTETSDPRCLSTHATADPELIPSVMPRIGKHLRQYSLIDKLGQGGFGEVWEAEDTETGRIVALKILTRYSQTSGQHIERFKREGRLAASIDHPNCVYIFTADEIDCCPVIAMELVRGGTLQEKLDQEGKQSSQLAVDYILDIINGLEAAYQKGIIHRDVKPSNCFLDDQDAIKIGDFGLSRTLDSDEKLTVTGSFIGTPAFASPEQVRGQAIDFRTDIYSVGATLYALLSGYPPFQSSHAGGLLAQILEDEPRPLSELGLSIPTKLEKIMFRCLQKKRENRFQSYSELRELLLPFSSQQPFLVGSPATPSERFIALSIDMIFLMIFMYILLPTLLFGGPFKHLHHPLETLYSISVIFLYFAVQEVSFTTSIGKKLFNLYITSPGGTPTSQYQRLLRVIFFMMFLHFSNIAHVVFPFLPGPAIDPLLDILGICIVLSTFRAKNGYAGLHEIFSKTRVITKYSEGKMKSRDVPTLEAPYEARENCEEIQLGPYVSRGIEWQKEGQKLYLAYDNVLKRNLWIHQFDDVSASLPPEIMNVNHPSRLRWIQSSRKPGDLWDAYETPTGSSYRTWITFHAPFSWMEIRKIIDQIVIELKQEQEGGNELPLLSLDRLWIDKPYNIKLLPFPVSMSEQILHEEHTYASTEWLSFINAVVVAGLEGDAEFITPTQGVLPHVPLPAKVKAFLTESFVQHRDMLSIDEFRTKLANIAADNTETTFRHRLAGLFTLPLYFFILSLVLLSTVIGTYKIEFTLFLCVLIMIPFLVLAIITRGGWILRYSNIALQNRQGEEASTTAVIVRSLVVWTPLLGPFLAYHVLKNVVPPDLLVSLLGFVGGGAFLLGLIYTILHPNRGIQDHIAGTWLVPK